MGLIDLFLPERLPRQFVYAGDRHAETVRLRDGRVDGRSRTDGTALADDGGGDWAGVAGALRAEETGVVFNAAPFIYNFFDFDQLPWQRKGLRELVAWRLQKIFPEDIAAYDHRFFVLDRRRVFSILVRRALLERVEEAFHGQRAPLTYIGNSTMEMLARARRAKTAPDFFLERDSAGCCMVFLSRRAPIYIRKFKSGPVADTVEEIGKTVAFVRNQYGIEPRRYWLLDHQGEDGAVEALLAGGEFARLRAGMGEAPHIPGSR
ncbi:MAG: hypothetical protein MUC72_07480 [Acidobacteria bacterium]|jgi:hypothetical protein|nr:hypothetical protein [Acidobacteriota bacterium]